MDSPDERGLEDPGPTEERGKKEPERNVSPLVALQADLDRWFGTETSRLRRCLTLLSRRELWAVCVFRWGAWLHLACPRPLAILVIPLWRIWSAIVTQTSDIHIPARTRIGPGLFISHYGGIWINERVRIGEDCTLSPGVLIGAAGGGTDRRVFPVVGDRVWIGPHAVVTGGAKVGDDVVVGANSLVVGRVPNRAVVVGVPATVLNYWGSSRVLQPHRKK